MANSNYQMITHADFELLSRNAHLEIEEFYCHPTWRAGREPSLSCHPFVPF